MTPRGLRDVVAQDAHHVVTKSQRGLELLRQPFRFRARGLLPLQALALHDERSRPPGHRPEEEQVLIGELKGRRRTHQRDPDEVFAMKQRDAVQGALRDLPQRLALDVRIGRPRHHRGFAPGRDLPREAFADPQTEPAPQVLLEATGGDADDEVDVAGRLQEHAQELVEESEHLGLLERGRRDPVECPKRPVVRAAEARDGFGDRQINGRVQPRHLRRQSRRRQLARGQLEQAFPQRAVFRDDLPNVVTELQTVEGMRGRSLRRGCAVETSAHLADVLAEVVEERRDVIEQDRALEALGRLESADARLPIRDDLFPALADEVRQPPRLLSLTVVAQAGPRKKLRSATGRSHGLASGGGRGFCERDGACERPPHRCHGTARSAEVTTQQPRVGRQSNAGLQWPLRGSGMRREPEEGEKGHQSEQRRDHA